MPTLFLPAKCMFYSGLTKPCDSLGFRRRTNNLSFFKNPCIIHIMDIKPAVTKLAALAHEQRLTIFRLLVRAGPSGMAAGDIAEAVKSAPTATSFHLKELDRAGLIHATRDGRYIRYAAHFEGMRKLLEFLTEDCCQGQPELCGKGFKVVKKVLVKGDKR